MGIPIEPADCGGVTNAAAVASRSLRCAVAPVRNTSGVGCAISLLQGRRTWALASAHAGRAWAIYVDGRLCRKPGAVSSGSRST